MEGDVEATYGRTYIDSENKGKFTSDEWKCYALIEEFRDKKVLVYSSNRKLYLDAIQERPATVFFECERKMMNVFDVEMAIATAKAFLLCNNAEKNRFSIDFIKESLQRQNKTIATGHTDKFIKIVEELIEKSAET